MRVGVIADTHRYFDPRIRAAFTEVSAILHAGDIGAEEVLRELADLAPVTAVVGNNDGSLAHLDLPTHANLVISGVGVHLVHRLQDASPPEHTRVVVYGHSHRALVEHRDGVLYVNPGAAGRVGFHRELTVAMLTLDGPRSPYAKITTLGLRAAQGNKRIGQLLKEDAPQRSPAHAEKG